MLRYGDNEKLFKLNLVSNGDATPDDFARMMQAYNMAKLKKSRALTKENVLIKSKELEKIKKFGTPKYTDQQLEQMKEKNLERRIKEGKIGGVNLTYLKVELQTEIALLERKMKDTKTTEKTKKEIISALDKLYIRLAKVQDALVNQLEKNQLYIEGSDDRGETHKMTVKELE